MRRWCSRAASPTPTRCAPIRARSASCALFFDPNKPIAAICHDPWTLIEADAVRGKQVTSWPSLKTDLKNAGPEWIDREVVVDHGLATSRKPDDLPAFCAKIIEEFEEHQRRAA
jgi:protease I